MLKVSAYSVHWANFKIFPAWAKKWRKMESGMQRHSQGYPLKSARKYSSIPGGDYLTMANIKTQVQIPSTYKKSGKTAMHTCDPSIGARDWKILEIC